MDVMQQLNQIAQERDLPLEELQLELEEALAACGRLKRCIEGKCGKMEGQQLACCQAELLAFRDACGKLGLAISRFPNRIRVV